MKKTFLLIIIFYFLVILQTSFFLHFPTGSWWNLILILIILINLFEAKMGKLGLLSAFIGGFFLDVFSSNFFGFWVLISFLLALFIKFILKYHLEIPVLIKD